MDFDAIRQSISGLLTSGKTFVVPRFQREYSWGEPQCKIFYSDLLKNIRKNEKGELETSDYYWGSLLLVGDYDSDKKLDIVDGQQRLTTITIFLSALYDAFVKAAFPDEVTDKIWEKIMAKDEDGRGFVVVENLSAHPYFQRLIQTKERDSGEPTAEEHDAIKNAFLYFQKELKDENTVVAYFGGDVSYQNCLKAIRDQLLRGVIIRISTKNKETASAIYENINSKGLPLEPIDLIKNELFSALASTVPTDEANNHWQEIRKNLAGENDGEYISMSMFFRHFWNSAYGSSSDKDLFKKFKSKVKPAEYLGFLKQMEKMSSLYSTIARPSVSQRYDKNDAFIKEALKSFNNAFGVVQTRVVLLALLSAYDEDRISSGQLKNVLNYLQGFHFAYSGLLGGRTNRFFSKYIKYALKITGAKDRQEMGVVLDEFEKAINDLFPSQNDFVTNFCKKLTYSKCDTDRNKELTKFAVNQLENSYSGLNTRTDGSIEHIINEDGGRDITLNIGNLILLETKINNEIPERCVTLQQKKPYYAKSSYSHMKEFLQGRESFDENDIQKRAFLLAKRFYVKVLKKKWIEPQTN